MKFFNKILKYILPGLVISLLLFVPLYPKLPLINVTHTWVYVRVEDFLVLLTLTFWVYLLLRKKVTLRTPLTIPILVYWIVGAIATIHGVVIIFPTIAGVFPNVALLAYLRHIEYLGVFFAAYSAVKSKKFVILSIWTIVIAFLGVVAYGFGQKYLSFPAYLTMNEEYAKGVPIVISALGRVSSTFAGHYDLAAYLVLIIPVLVSLFFGFRNIFIKIFMIASSLLGIIILFWTVSRVSFFALFIALLAVLFFNKKKLVFILLPLILVASVIFFYSRSSLLSRFNNTVKEINVLVDAKTGDAIGQVKVEQRSYLQDKTLIHEKELLAEVLAASPSADKTIVEPDLPLALTRSRIAYQIAVVQAKQTSTGETLPQGSEYVNLALSPVVKRFDNFFYEYPPSKSTASASILLIQGSYLVKRASAYDLSFTTRFQGEWPNTLLAFTRNLFFGSGYGSVSLAVDNNYLRMLGETGLLGTTAFILIFVVLGVYIRKSLISTDDKLIKSLAFGFCAGAIGLSLNATLIDVFEASKVAFQLWLMAGIVVGALSLYRVKPFDFYHELKRIITSSYAVITYIVLLIFAIFSSTLSNYFIGDDFTWFRWAADCKSLAVNCSSLPATIGSYFLNSNGFFYRPGTKTYFLIMYHLFALNQVVYHAVSISLHLIVVILLYVIARKIFKNNLMAAAASLIFLLSSGYMENVLWVAATGHLFSEVFILVSFYLFIKWHETKKGLFLLISVISALISLTFYELGIITPFLAIAYVVFKAGDSYLKSGLLLLRDKITYLLFIPNIIYLVVRFFANTHWFSGDYNYNLIKLPFNFVGNIFGYLLISLLGPLSYPFYEKLRELMKANIPVALLLTILFVAGMFFIAKLIIKNLDKEEKRIIAFALTFTIICLIPFVGLGNISFRYSYLASFGVIMILVILTAKLYRYLTYYGRDIALAVLATLISVFVLFHVIQAQQEIIAWRGAGEKVQNFLASIDSLYTEVWSNIKADLYFVNVPRKSGDAFVFPVGLSDSVWFAFKNENINVIEVPSLKDVPIDAYTSLSKWVFVFQPDGSLKRLTIVNKTIK